MATATSTNKQDTARHKGPAPRHCEARGRALACQLAEDLSGQLGTQSSATDAALADMLGRLARPGAE
jgi:hypothetical protein